MLHELHVKAMGWCFFVGGGKWRLYRFLSVGLAFGRVGRLCRRPGVGFDVGTRALAYSGL